MKLGAFSISLAVKDVKASRAFYEKLGFSDLGGVLDQNWLIMTDGSAVIGLFQGMFDQNTLTFNPGWDQAAKPFDPFDDIRAIEADLENKGIAFHLKTDATASSGPAHFMIFDPDGNPILVDQHR
jgi:lactoylglutathione lyase